jgi:endonuclease YncB( thermonuclease family)
MCNAGKVTEIVSGDTIVVAVSRGAGLPEERRISLASIRAPRLGRRDEKEAPYATEVIATIVRRLLLGFLLALA